ncbi:MAG: hypothetical protein ACQESR_29450, partial [Planctomycetota bacterium]
VWYRCALAQLGSSEADAYKATCRGMVEAFRDGDSPNPCYWTAWTCLLSPNSVEDYAPLVRMAKQAVEEDPDSEHCLKTLGGILYRAGRADEAVQRLTEANQLLEDPDTESQSSPAYTWYFLAMAHDKLGHETDTRKWLDKATQWTDKVLSAHEDGTAPLAWNRRLTLKLLRDEAEGMIDRPRDEPKDGTETKPEERQEAKG